MLKLGCFFVILCRWSIAGLSAFDFMDFLLVARLPIAVPNY